MRPDPQKHLNTRVAFPRETILGRQALPRVAKEGGATGVASPSHEHGEVSTKKGGNPKSRGFVVVDIRKFEEIRDWNLGLEEAAAYLSLAVSTDQGNITSTGGINSIMTYSGLSRAEARRAVQRLEKSGLVKGLTVERPRARTVPRFNLPQHDPRTRLAAKEQALVDAINAGRQPVGKDEINAVQRAQAKGHLEKRSSGWHVLEHVNQVAFIPNSFVRAKEGLSPLGRLVNIGELGPLMLAVELYHLQDLMNERGVPAKFLRAHYGHKRVAWLGQHRLHFLEPGRKTTDPATGSEQFSAMSCDPDRFHDYEQSRFWTDLQALERSHIVEWVAFSANGRPPTGDPYSFNRPQRPLGVLRNKRQDLDAPESIPAFVAYLIAVHQANKGQAIPGLAELIGSWRRDSPLIAVENQSVAHVEGVGILRMTHRADTENCKVWIRDTRRHCSDALFFAEQVARENFPQISDIATKLRDKVNLKAAISM